MDVDLIIDDENNNVVEDEINVELLSIIKPSISIALLQVSGTFNFLKIVKGLF